MLRRTNKYIPVMLDSARPKKADGRRRFWYFWGCGADCRGVDHQQPKAAFFHNNALDHACRNRVRQPGFRQRERAGRTGRRNRSPGRAKRAGRRRKRRRRIDRRNQPCGNASFRIQGGVSRIESRFAAVAGAHSLRMLSFKLALAQANGTVEDICSYFTGLEKGETPGEWGRRRNHQSGRRELHDDRQL